MIEDLDQVYDYADLGCNDWPKETVAEKEGVSCGPNNAGRVIEIGFAVSNNLQNNVLITSCLGKLGIILSLTLFYMGGVKSTPPLADYCTLILRGCPKLTDFS